MNCHDMDEADVGYQEYEVQAKLGYATDTYDSEGQVTHKSSGATMSPSQSRVLSVLDQFRGQIQQVPPMQVMEEKQRPYLDACY